MSEATTNQSVSESSVSSRGKVSRGFCIFGGVMAIFGGIALAGLKARGSDSLMEAIANGMGYYFIGKGIFMIAVSLNFREAIRILRDRQH